MRGQVRLPPRPGKETSPRKGERAARCDAKAGTGYWDPYSTIEERGTSAGDAKASNLKGG